MENKDKITYALLLVFIAVFIAVAAKGLKTPQPGDENVYFYMVKLINEGKLPYRDFFYAHPPLDLYITSLVYNIFGFNIIFLKLVPLVSTFITAFFVFKTAKEKFGRNEAVISSLIFLFSYSVLFNYVFSLGITTSTMFLVIGFYFVYVRKRYYFGGLFFALAASARLLALVPVFIILLFVLLSSKKSFLKLASAFLVIFFLFNGIFIFVSGSAYVNSVYKYHFLKNAGLEQNFDEYFDVIKLNLALFLSSFLIILARNKKTLSLPLAISITYLVFLFSIKRLFGFYFLIVLPFLAIIGGYSLSYLYKRDIKKKYKIIFLFIFFLFFFWSIISDIIFLQKIGFSGFERGDDLTEFALANSNQKTKLFGDSSIAPLLALMTNKEIALDFADTNDQVFSSGIVDANDLLQKLKSEEILFILRDTGLSSLNEIREFVSKNCEFLASFRDELEGNYIFYKC